MIVINLIPYTYRKPLALVFSAVLFICGVLFYYCLPDPLFNEPTSKILLSRNGKLLGAKIATDQQWRFPYSDRYSEKYKKAVILFEDGNFHIHPGVDPLALCRAFYLNMKAGEIVSGGSTISMQVIRLMRKNRNRTHLEKAIEILMALRLELRYSKSEILSLYAAHAPFGGNVVGVNTASWRYFGRDASRLSWAEAALLAVLPNSPALIHPGRNRERLKRKRDHLLSRLNDGGVIDDLEYKLALAEPLPGAPRPLPNHAPHLMTTLCKTRAGDTPSTSPSIFRTGVDYDYQLKTMEVLKKHHGTLSRGRIYNAAAMVLDNTTMDVVAYVGNVGDNLTRDAGQHVDVIQSPRSTGSILKPLLYAAMLEAGKLAPMELVADVPTRYSGFKPQNYDRKYRGAVPAAFALSRSLNVPAVIMLRRFGIHRFYDFLKNAGMTTLHRKADDYGLTLILGGAEGTLFDISKMYMNLARLAAMNPLPGHDDFTWRSPTILKTDDPPPGSNAELSPGSAWLTVKALQEVARPGLENFWKTFSSSRKIAWKTGTSYGLRDAWAVGCTPSHTVGVWVGNANGVGVSGLTGISAAAPILFDIFNFLPKSDWGRGPAHQLKTANVCETSGFLAAEHCKTKTMRLPVRAHYSKLCPFHQRIHLDRARTHRVHAHCESVGSMIHENWFVLPPLREFYYKKFHPEYKTLPPFRTDCLTGLGPGRSRESGRTMQLVYPETNTRIYIPVDLNGQKTQTVFEAVHRERETTIFWHLDETYLGRTKDFHQIALAPAPGKHKLILVDEKGRRLERGFEVMGLTGGVNR